MTEAIRRAEAYREAGADGVYVEGLRSAAELKRLLERESPHDPVHLLAHSMGGLDARYMISRLGMAAHVGSVEHASHQLGLSQFFIGAIVVAIVGNAAEHYVAVVAAVKDQMDLTMSIAIGSAAQVGLLLAPLIALASIVIGPARMPLVFNGYELVALLCGGWLATAVTFNGVSTRWRGAGLLAAYSALAVAFLFA